MSGTPRQPSRRERLRAAIGPEQIAIALIAILVLGALGSAIAASLDRNGIAFGQDPGATQAPPTPPPSVFVVPPTPVPTATPEATPTPAPTPAATPAASAPATTAPSAGSSPAPVVAAWAPLARTILESDRRIIEAREEIRAELATKPTSAADLARLIRQANESLSFTLSSIDRLAGTDAPADLVARLADAHQTALDGAVETLGLALSNVKGYTAGARTLVKDLEKIEPLAAGLAAAAGIDDPIPAVVIPSAAASASASASPAP